MQTKIGLTKLTNPSYEQEIQTPFVPKSFKH